MCICVWPVFLTDQIAIQFFCQSLPVGPGSNLVEIELCRSVGPTEIELDNSEKSPFDACTVIVLLVYFSECRDLFVGD